MFMNYSGEAKTGETMPIIVLLIFSNTCLFLINPLFVEYR